MGNNVTGERVARRWARNCCMWHHMHVLTHTLNSVLVHAARNGLDVQINRIGTGVVEINTDHACKKTALHRQPSSKVCFRDALVKKM